MDCCCPLPTPATTVLCPTWFLLIPTICQELRLCLLLLSDDLSIFQSSPGGVIITLSKISTFSSFKEQIFDEENVMKTNKVALKPEWIPWYASVYIQTSQGQTGISILVVSWTIISHLWALGLGRRLNILHPTWSYGSKFDIPPPPRESRAKVGGTCTLVVASHDQGRRKFYIL